MKKNKYLLLISSLVALALLAAAAIEEYFHRQWRRIQAAARSEAGPVPVQLRQIVNPSLRAADRCVSCHVGMAPGEGLLRGGDVLRPHKPVVHDPAEYGCTVCHGGQGQATEKDDAHGRVEFWPEPMLPREMSWAGCGVCHVSLGVPGAKAMKEAELAFERLDCYACHRVDGRGGTIRPDGGGMEGPDLSFAGIRGYDGAWHEKHVKKAATASKGDEVIVVRPGTTPALALGLANVILREKLYDTQYVNQWTDLPVLVRMDTLQYLRAQEVFGGAPSELKNTRVLGKDEREPPPIQQDRTVLSGAMRNAWGDFVWWDRKAQAPRALTRDGVGRNSGVQDPLLEGSVEVKLAGGKTVRCRPVFDLVREYAAHFDPKTTEEITWAPAAAVEALARHIAKEPGTTLFAVGMGPNQFCNSDNKDRDILLLAALTGNLGKIGGNVGSYAGNYRVALFNGAPQYTNENPFDIELDPAKPARVRQYWKPESAHYYNHEDHPLRVGNKLLTGKTHIPAPTKSMWFANANSILGNVKWHFNTVINVLPRIELIAVNEWWWSASCEWADIVFGVDAWFELKHPDMTASVTNPFLVVFPRTPMKRAFQTIGDIEVYALVASKLAELTGDNRFLD